LDYFNKEERDSQKKFSQKRDAFFGKIIVFLSEKGVKPNIATVVGVLFLVIACLIPSKYYIAVSIMLILYLLMDGVDGGLARYQKINHSGGSIMDMWADQMGVILIPAAAIFHLSANGVYAVLFSNGYIIFIVLIIFLNQLEVKIKPFFRVKYILYALYALSLALSKDFISLFLLVFAIYYWIAVFYCLHKVYQHYDSQ